MITREQAKEKLLADCKIITYYSWNEDRQKQDVEHWHLSDIKTLRLLDKIYDSLEATIEDQEIIIKDMAQPKIEFIDTSCMRCKNVNDCSLCENVKNETGMKLREMSFFCFEPKAQP